MYKPLLVGLIIGTLLGFPFSALARVTPNDQYQAKRQAFQTQLDKIADQGKRNILIEADVSLNDVNLAVCNRFDQEIARMTAILEEEKRRQGVTETIVAYGRGETPLDSAAYYLNFAAEAVAYQKIQDYTPQISGSNYQSAVRASRNNLRSNLLTLQGKIIRAKQELTKTLDYYEKN